LSIRYVTRSIRPLEAPLRTDQIFAGAPFAWRIDAASHSDESS